MLPFITMVVSFLLLLAGVLWLYEFTLYTDDQKSQVPLLAPTYFRSIVLIKLLGIFGLVAATTSLGDNPAVLGVMGLFAALPAILQHHMHRQMGLETSPLADRVSTLFAPRGTDDPNQTN